MGHIHLKDISLQHPGNPAKKIVDSLTMDLAPGSITMLLGINGSGKTTLLRALSGQMKYTGEMSVDGRNLTSMKVRERARHMAFLGQEEVPAPGLSVYEAVALARIPHPRNKVKDHEAVESALRAVNLWELKDRTTGTLSGGQKRRVLLARCFAQEVRFIILDEPMNHLDMYYQIQLVQLLRARGVTVLMSVHDMDLAYQCADQVVLIHRDGGASIGSPQQICAPGILNSEFAIFTEVGQELSQAHVVIKYRD
ncbi:MAG: ABC transporter ATP-binding protein [Corynebacterium sp.]|nr:ABC transporter ATP-binding protein [Corynebacterium sp.]